MPTLTYQHPASLRGADYFGGSLASIDRLRTWLILTGHGHVSRGAVNVKLSTDFMSVPPQPSPSFSLAHLRSKLPSCTERQLKRLLREGATKNIALHRNIFNETAHCIYHFEQSSFIASFVHLYRLIEQTALYLPFIAILSGATNLTFKEYKDLVNADAKNDLSVLKNFSSKHLDRSIAATIARISFASNSYPSDDCNVLKHVGTAVHVLNSGPDWVEVRYEKLDRLIVGVRNEFFHYLYHGKNISLIDMKDPDEFLGACLPPFISYFATLYRELLKAEWELFA